MTALELWRDIGAASTIVVSLVFNRILFAEIGKMIQLYGLLS